MDDFPRESPRFWVALCIFGVALILAVVMSVILTVKAHAQEILCEPMPTMVKRLGVAKELIAWSGVTVAPDGSPIELLIFQSSRGTWSLVRIIGPTGCIIGKGNAGTPIENGKGI
jgi:hypothetical protein